MSSYDLAPPVRPDRASLATKVALGVALAAALLVSGALLGRSLLAGGVRPGEVVLALGPRNVQVAPDALVAETPREAGPARIDLAFGWPGFHPAVRTLRGANGRTAEAPLGNTILVTLSVADDSPDPGLRPVLLYGRFLEPTVWSYPGELLARRFRPGSPYAGEELVFLPPDGRAFAARCPGDQAGADSRCIAAWRRRGLDILVSFDRALLADAAQLREQILTWFERAVR